MKNYLTLLFISFSFLGFGNESEKLFMEANTAYENQEFSLSIENYQKLIDSGIDNDDIHYNIANAYFQNKDLAQAIYHFEKAIKINPAHDDAKHNLAFANKKSIDKIEGIPDLFLYRWWRSVFNLMSADSWAKLMLVFLFSGVICLFLYFYMSQVHIRKISFYLAASLIVLAVLSWFFASEQQRYLETKSYAIIMEPTVNINSSPSLGSSKLFVLHEGTKVKIKDSSSGWFKVSIPNGNEGWIESKLIRGI